MKYLSDKHTFKEIFFNCIFPKNGQKSYVKPCKIIHVIFMNES